MKTPLILSLALFAALASAQTTSTAGTRSKGEAKTADGRMAKFEAEAYDREGTGGGVRVEGKVHFEQIANAAGPMVHIHMAEADFIKVSGNVCDFSGKGHLKTLISGKEQTLHGKVEVETVNGGKAGAGDTFTIHFVAKDGLKFTFSGALVKGNVAVYSR